jgi:hypothetical protein
VNGNAVDETGAIQPASDELLAAYHDSLPNCPTCGDKITKAIQGISRSGQILRVDGMANLELKDFEEHSYSASVILECEECGDLFRPQDGVEAYSQKETVKLFDVPERINADTTSFDREDFWG